jgi:hypothetical protein
MKPLSAFILLLLSGAASATERPYYPEEPNAAEIIREKCKSEWPDDFNMRNYCENIQWEGLAKLYGPKGTAR